MSIVEHILLRVWNILNVTGGMVESNFLKEFESAISRYAGVDQGGD